MNGTTKAERFWLGVTTTAKGAYEFAVDVIRDSSSGTSMAVLLSSVKGKDRDKGEFDLECKFGLTNVIAWGDAFRARGVPCAETLISVGAAGDTIEVWAPLRSMTDEDEDSSPRLLITLSGVRFERSSDAEEASGPFSVLYSQLTLSPAVGSPDKEVFAVADVVTTPRQLLAAWEGNASMQVHDTVLPALKAYSGKRLDLTRAWAGVLDRGLKDVLAQPKPAQTLMAPQAGAPSRCAAAAPAWTPLPKPLVATGYRFTDVEFVGMRIDLRPYGSAADDLLEDMIKPLNFHLHALDPADAMAFKYQPAARSLVIELVRYGRMYWGKDVPADGPDCFESQFELLMRVLVGRVDDGSAQARDPAVFVPAIFVDNAWSKLIGREFQGFEKRMARFVDREGLPLASTYANGDGPSRLFDIAGVDQLVSLAPDAPEPTRIVGVDLPPIDPDWYCNAEPVDSFGVSLVAGPRWRQSDFPHREFRRSFARDVLADGLDTFHSIQVAPVDNRPLPPAWLTGTFTLRGLRAAFPKGIATLTLNDDKDLPCAFRGLHELMRGEPIAMPTGDWYVGKSSVDLEVDDGLV